MSRLGSCATAGDKKLLAFPVYPGVTELDLVGPLTVLRDMKLGSPYRSVVVAQHLEPVATDARLQIVPAATFAEVYVMTAGVSAGKDMALYLAARLTDEPTARRVQAAIDHDPQPPFGSIIWAHVDRVPRLPRGAMSLVAPLATARPRRLLRAELRARRSAVASAPS